MFGTNPRDYDLKVELATCFNGLAAVYLAQYLKNGTYIAVKKYRMDKMTKEESNAVSQEMVAMRQFNHPSLYNYYTSFVWKNELFMVAPLYCFGSCKDTIRNCFNTGFPEILVSLIMRDVVSGLEYLHRRGFIHRALRGSHIFLSQSKAVLAGFREGTNVLQHGHRLKVLHQLAPCSERSLNWLAPEVLEQNLNGYTEKSDIYSIGITCCELANGIEPFADSQPTFMFTEKVRGNVPTLLDRSTCPASDELIDMTACPDSAIAAHAQQIYSQRMFSDEFHQVTEICMEKRPSNRWSAKQLLSHSFFKQCKTTSLLSQLQIFGVEMSDYSQLRDESLALISAELNELSMRDSDWNWEF